MPKFVVTSRAIMSILGHIFSYMYKYVQNIARCGITKSNDVCTLIDAAKYPPKRQYQFIHSPAGIRELISPYSYYYWIVSVF